MWDHQRYPLLELRRSVTSFVEELRARQSWDSHADDPVVVDIGCGNAPYRSLFERAGFTYTGCDIDGSPDVRIEVGAPVPLPDATANAVVSFQVLEHVWDLSAYLHDCRRLLCDGGLLYLSTHGNWPYHPHPTDYRRWTPMGLRGEIESRGFRVVEQEFLLGPPAWMINYLLLAVFELVRTRGALARLAAKPLFLACNLVLPLIDRLTPASIRCDNPSVIVIVAERG